LWRFWLRSFGGPVSAALVWRPESGRPSGSFAPTSADQRQQFRSLLPRAAPAPTINFTCCVVCRGGGGVTQRSEIQGRKLYNHRLAL
jgi:hypothetical protein